ncbi:MAG: prephenate dehydrogenase [Bacteroidetes bacterium]|nr:MAG: prephenate dehydrogenase [Bacteroidota bacterium]
MNITIIGLGLIGGSMALDLRANGFAARLIGVDANPRHRQLAQDMELVDEVMELGPACRQADIVLLAVPVNAIVSLATAVLDNMGADTVAIEVGSTKAEIAQAIAGHPRRAQFVLAHPMAGTEYSGPKAAISNLFQHKAAIICDPGDSSPQAVRLAERLFKSLFMRVIYMESSAHDVHAAYVSHISHISSYVLALTVLEKEKVEANIFNMASGGFASTVRLAKSSPRMWNDIYEQNAQNILDVLDIYIEKIQEFRDLIARGEFDETYRLMESANAIGKILKAPQFNSTKV